MIKFIDMFSGIGGFREGLTRAGGFECVGHCEIDKYANRSYNALFDTKGEWFMPKTCPTKWHGKHCKAICLQICRKSRRNVCRRTFP